VARITWYGHSFVAVELDGARFLTDPILRRRVAHLSHPSPVAHHTLGPIDAVLISHVHYDHFDIASLTRLDRWTPIVVPRNAGRVLRWRGFRRVLEVGEGDELPFNGVRVAVTHAEHGVVRRVVRVSPALGYVLNGSQSVYFAGDTDLFDGMAALAPLDVALLPVAGWGPRLPPGHLDPRRAAEALRLLRPRVAVPVHWGTLRRWFAAAPERTPADDFVRAAAELAPEVDVRVLELGESLSL
jgi:L-ascorbate metabolism protein UlaG (beta-lactamase superfamily)